MTSVSQDIQDETQLKPKMAIDLNIKQTLENQ